jgi:hypothetical protein
MLGGSNPVWSHIRRQEPNAATEAQEPKSAGAERRSRSFISDAASLASGNGSGSNQRGESISGQGPDAKPVSFSIIRGSDETPRGFLVRSNRTGESAVLQWLRLRWRNPLQYVQTSELQSWRALLTI